MGNTQERIHDHFDHLRKLAVKGEEKTLAYDIDFLSKARKIWEDFDKKKTGSLETNEMKDFFGSLYDYLLGQEVIHAGGENLKKEKEQHILAWVKQFDDDGDNAMSWGEFKDVLVSVLIDAANGYVAKHGEKARVQPSKAHQGELSRVAYKPLWKEMYKQDNIRVIVHGARNLISNHNAGKCDPWVRAKVKLQFGPAELHSSVIEDTRCPLWQEELMFPLNYDTQVKEKNLKLQVWNAKEEIFSWQQLIKPDCLGGISIPFDKLSHYATRQWVPLGNPSGYMDRPRGDLDIEICVINHNALALPIAPTLRKSGEIHVLVVEGRDLPVEELDDTPQCVLTMDWQVFKTEKLSGVSQPVWNGSLFTFDPTGTEINVAIMAGEVIVGQGKILLDPQFDGQVRELWLTMIDSKGEKTSSRVHLRVYQRCELEPREIESLGMSVYCYQEKMPMMKTGDAILFAGGTRFSGIIKHWSNSPISHIGIVVELPDPKDGDKKKLFVIESDQMEEGDYFSDGSCDGICYSLLQQRCHSYEGNMILLASLKKPLTPAQESLIIENAQKYRDEGVTFDVAQLLAIGVGIQNDEDYSQLFCSEFVTTCLKVTDVVPQTVNASMMSPFEVANFDCYEPNNQVLRFQLVTTQRIPIV
eukprot:TRINITY_DN12381_c0_g1_i1.p1 TRINITY_DN12381_c0_g1~~TRINITY_DN12381_c0_g1_i1.p1  ORF type:complete len:656 (+),score=139.29 TRINITY_DN12381_c0_g1_i1:44-1969(+)